MNVYRRGDGTVVIELDRFAAREFLDRDYDVTDEIIREVQRALDEDEEDEE